MKAAIGTVTALLLSLMPALALAAEPDALVHKQPPVKHVNLTPVPGSGHGGIHQTGAGSTARTPSTKTLPPGQHLATVHKPLAKPTDAQGEPPTHDAKPIDAPTEGRAPVHMPVAKPTQPEGRGPLHMPVAKPTDKADDK